MAVDVWEYLVGTTYLQVSQGSSLLVGSTLIFPRETHASIRGPLKVPLSTKPCGVYSVSSFTLSLPEGALSLALFSITDGSLPIIFFFVSTMESLTLKH